MTRRFGVAIAAALAAGSGGARADDTDAAAVLDKAIKALGGEERLAGAMALTWATGGDDHAHGQRQRDRHPGDGPRARPLPAGGRP